MFRGNWLHYIIAFGIAAFLGILAYVTQPAGLLYGEKSAEYKCTEKRYTIERQTDGQFSILVRTQASKCNHDTQPSISDQSTYPPGNIAEADLLAQKQMAHWTFWIGIFTATGLLILYITFHATRMAVEQTREIGRLQNMAYVSVKSAQMTIANERENSVLVCVKFVNTGHTPAENFDFSTNALLTSEEEVDFPILLENHAYNNVSAIAPGASEEKRAVRRNAGIPDGIFRTLRRGEDQDRVIANCRVKFSFDTLGKREFREVCLSGEARFHHDGDSFPLKVSSNIKTLKLIGGS